MGRARRKTQKWGGEKQEEEKLRILRGGEMTGCQMNTKEKKKKDGISIEK